MKVKEWLIKKLVGKTPVIMNVTIVLDEPIFGEKPNGIFDRCNIQYSERMKGGK